MEKLDHALKDIMDQQSKDIATVINHLGVSGVQSVVYCYCSVVSTAQLSPALPRLDSPGMQSSHWTLLLFVVVLEKQ